jgi:hypothetical protein
MNPGTAEPPPFAPSPPAAGWSWQKIILLILLAGAAHLALLHLLGTSKNPSVRNVKNVPVFQLADSTSEFVRLTDPTLFAAPHPEDFLPEYWNRPPAVAAPEFHWAEAPPFLALSAANLGAAFNAFLQTNRSQTITLNFKPEPPWSAPGMIVESALPQSSAWQLAGELAGRRIVHSFSPPPQTVNDVIAPSRAQLLVAPDGTVLSTVLLESSGLEVADQQALALARALQFAPAKKLMFGEIVFNWHTVSMTAP